MSWYVNFYRKDEHISALRSQRLSLRTHLDHHRTETFSVSDRVHVLFQVEIQEFENQV